MIDLAAQYIDMADSVAALLKTDYSLDAKQMQQRLLNEASNLEATVILATLGQMAPHYDAMVSVVRDLKTEVAKQAKIEQIASFADKALAIAVAFRAGNVSLVITSIDDAVKLVKSARS